MSCFAVATFRARLFLALVCAALLTAHGHTQITGPLLRVSVPFAFESDTHHFSPGLYYMRVDNGRLTLVSSADRFVTTVLPDEALDPAPRNSVVFRRYGDRYFLREVWIAGRKTHVHCPPTQAEKQVQVAMANQHATGVTVAALDTSK